MVTAARSLSAALVTDVLYSRSLLFCQLVFLINSCSPTLTGALLVDKYTDILTNARDNILLISFFASMLDLMHSSVVLSCEPIVSVSIALRLKIELQ